MADVTLDFLAQQQVEILAHIHGIRQDIEMLTRIVLRLDNTVDALRANVKTLWLDSGDLRRRIEAIEERKQQWHYSLARYVTRCYRLMQTQKRQQKQPRKSRIARFAGWQEMRLVTNASNVYHRTLICSLLVLDATRKSRSQLVDLANGADLTACLYPLDQAHGSSA